MTEMSKVAQQALEALIYHVEQTRPIESTTQAIAALRAALQDKAVEVRDNEVLRQVFALCEDTEGAELSGSSADSQSTQDFMRGRKFEAKQIRRAIGTWFQDEFCGRSFMGEPATNNTAQTTQPAPVVPDGFAIVPVEPTVEMLGGLASCIMLAFDINAKSPALLINVLTNLGHEIPQWLRDEIKDPESNHVLSKGTRAVIIYRAMLAASQQKASE